MLNAGNCYQFGSSHWNKYQFSHFAESRVTDVHVYRFLFEYLHSFRGHRPWGLARWALLLDSFSDLHCLQTSGMERL